MASRPATRGSPTEVWSQYDIVMRTLSLIAIHCQLQMVRIYLDQHESGPDDMDPEVTRTIARLLRALGQVLNDIEACAAQDAQGGATGNDEQVAFVMSYYYDVREVVDDFLV
ncbi:hypothetical protein PG994_008672 [Apiospora phragmitis]|uniref:Uncharacterized protein n=1 Tax=Apiospora phragmitis TaxID=2905665 RepID=A0ABR1UH48_9PEZI